MEEDSYGHKDISDVIKAVRVCKSDGYECIDCPYYSSNGCHKCYLNYGNHLFDDILYYLTMYKKGLNDADNQ